MVAANARGGMTTLPFLFGTPAWAAGDDGQACFGGDCASYAPRTQETRDAFADFAAAAVRRYGPGGNFWDQHRALPYRPIETWQIWNEPNLSSFYSPSVDPSGYALLVAAGAAGIRSEDPDAQVLLAGLTGNRTNRKRMSTRGFLKGLYTVPGIATSFDGIAVHPYNRKARGTIDQIKAARKIASANLDNAGIWVTEVGWASAGKRKKWGLVKSRRRAGPHPAAGLHEDHAWRRALGRAGGLLVRVAGHRQGPGRLRLVSVVGPARSGRRAQARLLGASGPRPRVATGARTAPAGLGSERPDERSMMASDFKRGDLVEWNFRGRTVRGTVRRRLTKRTEIAGRVVAASKDDPRYLVRSERSGAETTRRAVTLRPVDPAQSS